MVGEEAVELPVGNGLMLRPRHRHRLVPAQAHGEEAHHRPLLTAALILHQYLLLLLPS